MKKLIGVFICALFAVAMIGCGSNETKETTAAGKEITANSFETPYGSLPLPDSYLENVNIEVVSEDPYTIAFYNKESGAKLYTLYYGEEHDFCLGTLETDGKEVQLYFEESSLDESAEDYNINISLQADVNIILDKLEESGNFTKGGQ